MVPSLAGRNAIVTGSARGLGAQFAIDLAKAGANVLIVSVLRALRRFLNMLIILLRITHQTHLSLKLRVSWKKSERSTQPLSPELCKQMCMHPLSSMLSIRQSDHFSVAQRTLAKIL